MGNINSEERTDSGSIRQFCTFVISDRLFGVDILDVKEINPETDFTPIYHSPKEIVGYVNIRGQIHLVIDLRLLLGYESRLINEKSRVVLFKTEVGPHFGVMVDQIGDVVEIDENLIEDQRQYHKKSKDDSELKIGDSRLITGVCKLNSNLLVILDARKFLKAINNI